MRRLSISKLIIWIRSVLTVGKLSRMASGESEDLYTATNYIPNAFSYTIHHSSELSLGSLGLFHAENKFGLTSSISRLIATVLLVERLTYLME